MEPLVDRRMFERMESDFTGWYSLKDEDKIQGEFLGIDFSADGLKLNSAQSLPEGRALDLSLVSSQAKSPISETGQVVWQREISPGRWQAGLHFYQPHLLGLWPMIDYRRYSLEVE